MIHVIAIITAKPELNGTHGIMKTESALPASTGPHDLPISGGRSGWLALG